MRDLRVLLLPLVAVALVVLTGVAPSGSEPERPPSDVTVTESSYACPAGKAITVASGQVRPGTGSTARVLPDGKRDAELEDAKTWRTSAVDGPGVVVRQQGRGSGAVGFFAGTAPKAGGGGLVVGPCPGVVDDAWLLGLGSGERHFSTLILTNLADSPAAVDLTLWGPEGRVDAVGAEGIVVEPSSVRRIRIDDLAAGEPELAVHVHRRRGSLSAVVNDTSTADSSGTEPISTTMAPRRRQVVGGLVQGAEGRTLLLLNPGDETARVDVEVIGPKRTFTPSGRGSIKVRAGSTRSVTVPRSAGSGPQALQVTSDEPVAASVRMTPGDEDYAYAEATPPLSGPAIVPVGLGDDVAPPRLVLSAPGRAAEADVQAYDTAMRPLMRSTVSITAGTTTWMRLEARDAAYFVVRPRGEVVGAATYTDGDGISSLALTPAPITVLGPQVRAVS